MARTYHGETIMVTGCDVPVYHGVGKVEFTTGVTYEGEFHHGRLHGTGCMEWHERGVMYKGEFKDNELTGNGSFSWPDQSVYTGEVQYGKRHGRGVFLFGDLGYYDGEWEDGVPHGYGSMVYDPNRNISYEGDFVHGKREGKGTMHYADGSFYIGQWKDDVKWGHGVMTWMGPDGYIPLERYDGDWKYNSPEGSGRYEWLQPPHRTTIMSPAYTKNWYEGDFQQGKRHGRGTFVYANGTRYEGEWQDNVKDGYGLFFYEDGRVFVGLFRQDRSIEGSYATPGSEMLSTSSSFADILLYIDDLLPISDTLQRQKARKVLGHAVLRINTDLRALYRKKSCHLSICSEDPTSLLTFFECRQVLFHCGFYVPTAQLESFLHDVRKAQRTSILACASSLNIADKVLYDKNVRTCRTFSMTPCLEVEPKDDLLLFREFVELLVRLAYSWVTTAEEEGSMELLVTPENPVFLATVFTDLYDQIMYDREHTIDTSSPGWLPSLHAELLDQQLQNTFIKHHEQLQDLYRSCATSTDKSQSEVSVRSLLVTLHHLQRPIPLFTSHFQLHDALAALHQAFTLTFPPLKHNFLRSVCQSKCASITEPAAFFMSTKFVFSDFQDALAIVLFTKQRTTLERGKKDANTHETLQEFPLHLLVDQFMQSVQE